MSQETFSLDDEIIDLEWASGKGHQPPKGKKYRYKVDGILFTSDTETRTGRVILEKAGKKPVDKFILRKKVKGSWVTIKPDDVVDFTEPGIEKFKTLPNDQTEGEITMPTDEKSLRRDFSLPEEDEDFLNNLGLPWEAVNVGSVQWIFIYNYRIPGGYNVTVATMAVRISACYPTAQLDMVYFYPALHRTDARPINNLTLLILENKEFQQWSRHRTSTNPWREGIDNLSTHVPLADAWLLNEFIKTPCHAISA